MKLLFLLISCTVVFTWCPDDSQVSGQTNDPVLSMDEHTAQAVLAEVNALRAKGCKCPGGKRFKPAPALKWNTLLEKAAQDHADDMNRQDYFNHKSKDGTGYTDRIRRTGYNWQFVGENIAMGYPTAKAVVEAWRASKDHCPNMMSPDFKDMGVGKSGPYWVQDFGARME